MNEDGSTTGTANTASFVSWRVGRGGAAGAFNLSGSPQPAAAGETARFRKTAAAGSLQTIAAAVGGPGAVGSTNASNAIGTAALRTIQNQIPTVYSYPVDIAGKVSTFGTGIYMGMGGAGYGRGAPGALIAENTAAASLGVPEGCAGGGGGGTS